MLLLVSQPGKDYVRQRTDRTWEEIHETQSERVSHRKYHHRLSRKGYIGLKEDEIKSGRLEPGVEPDRAILWKKAHKRKNGQEIEVVDEDLQGVCDKIDTLLEKKEKGEIQFSGAEDVLTAALESLEHSGRVRAVGGYITPKQYFNLPREKKVRITKEELMARDRQRDEKTQALESEIAQLKALISSGVNHHSPIQSEKGNGTCELSVERIENKVSFGMMYPREAGGKVHGIDIPLGHQCVSVDDIIKPDALLPVPIRGELETVRDALGSFLAWPEDLMSYTTTKIKKNERLRPSGEKRNKNDELQKLRAQFLQAKPSAKVPKAFNLLYKHATSWMVTAGVSIKVECKSEVFGHEKIIFLLHENVLALLEFEMLGQAVIASYMAHFHAEISERPELAETFAFIDPGSTYYLNADFEAYIVNRLKEGNPHRLFFLPHNQN